jgi:transcriptional regulator NrdR family protein
MICLICSSEKSKVIESRKSSDSTRRRRECLDCGNRFTTLEKVIEKPKKRKLIQRSEQQSKKKEKKYETFRSQRTDSFVVQSDSDEKDFLEGFLKGKI